MELMARTCKAERMNVQRLFARLFVIAGAVFWLSMVLGADLRYGDASVAEAASNALIPFVVIIVVLIVAWFYEMLAAALLLAGAVGIAVWGVLGSWELGVWFTMGSLFLAPAVIAGLLFFMAAQMQRVCELEERAKA